MGIAVMVLSVVWPVAAAEDPGTWRPTPRARTRASIGTALPRAPAPAFPFPNERCMPFAGGAQPAAHVSVPDAPALRGTGDFTVAFWMRKTGNVSDWARMVGKWCARQDLNLQPSGS